MLPGHGAANDQNTGDDPAPVPHHCILLPRYCLDGGIPQKTHLAGIARKSCFKARRAI
jgi:hypothetical protein